MRRLLHGGRWRVFCKINILSNNSQEIGAILSKTFINFADETGRNPGLRAGPVAQLDRASAF